METNNTKGAIEFCKDLKEVGFKYGGIEYDLNPHIDNIIELLQRGEENKKYKTMFNELSEYINGCEKRCEVACGIVYVSQLRDLEQKYFPNY